MVVQLAAGRSSCFDGLQIFDKALQRLLQTTPEEEQMLQAFEKNAKGV